jgi:hypothetical protein
MMDERKVKLLTRQFSKKLIRSRRQSGRTFSYVEGATVIQRLNEVFGHDWSFEIADRIVDLDNKQIAILGRLTVPRHTLEEYTKRISTTEFIKELPPQEGVEPDTEPDREEDSVVVETASLEFTVTKEQWGGAPIQVFKESKRIIDLGNDLKSATTDAIKKCATLLGIGLHLYHEDEVSRTFEFTEEDELEGLSDKEKESIKEDLPASSAQLQAVSQVLEKSNVQPAQLLKFLSKKALKELTKKEAGEIIKGKHSFWKQG